MRHAGVEAGSLVEMPRLPHGPPIHMIKLTERREITPYVRVHPDQEDR
jgi:hypothetical protein